MAVIVPAANNKKNKRINTAALKKGGASCFYKFFHCMLTHDFLAEKGGGLLSPRGPLCAAT